MLLLKNSGNFYLTTLCSSSEEYKVDYRLDPPQASLQSYSPCAMISVQIVAAVNPAELL